MKRKKTTILRTNMKYNNLNGIFQVMSINLVGAFAGIFIKRLDPNNDTLISLLNSLPAFFAVIAILIGTGLAVSIKNKKRAACIAFFITRLFYLFMAGIVFITPKYRAYFFVFLFSALNFPGSIGNFLWQSYFADIFSPSARAKVLSTRSFLSTCVGTGLTLVTGFLLRHFTKNSKNFIPFYQIIFIVAFILGCLEVYTLYKHNSDVKNNFAEISTGENPFTLKFLKVMINQKEYVYFMICVIFFHFSWQMGWPLFITYEYNYLHSNEMWSGIISTINGLCTAFGYTYWRKFSEKKGTAPTLTIGAIGMAITPIVYALSTSIKHIAFFTGILGFLSAAVLLILLSTLYEVAPKENRTSYIAIYNLVTSITLVIAPWVGMNLYKITNIWTAFWIIGLLRMSSALLFFKRQKSFVKQKAVE